MCEQGQQTRREGSVAVTSDQHTKRDGEDWLRLAEGVGQAARRSQDVDRKVMLGPSSGQESATREVDW